MRKAEIAFCKQFIFFSTMSSTGMYIFRASKCSMCRNGLNYLCGNVRNFFHVCFSVSRRESTLPSELKRLHKTFSFREEKKTNTDAPKRKTCFTFKIASVLKSLYSS